MDMLESNTNIMKKLIQKNVTFWRNLDTICGNIFLR